MGIVAAAGSLTDFVFPAAKSGLPADGLALTGFLEDGGKVGNANTTDSLHASFNRAFQHSNEQASHPE